MNYKSSLFILCLLSFSCHAMQGNPQPTRQKKGDLLTPRPKSPQGRRARGKKPINNQPHETLQSNHSADQSGSHLLETPLHNQDAMDVTLEFTKRSIACVALLSFVGGTLYKLIELF